MSGMLDIVSNFLPVTYFLDDVFIPRTYDFDEWQPEFGDEWQPENHDEQETKNIHEEEKSRNSFRLGASRSI